MNSEGMNFFKKSAADAQVLKESVSSLPEDEKVLSPEKEAALNNIVRDLEKALQEVWVGGDGESGDESFEKPENAEDIVEKVKKEIGTIMRGGAIGEQLSDQVAEISFTLKFPKGAKIGCNTLRELHEFVDADQYISRF